MLMHSVSSISECNLLPYLQVEGESHLSGQIKISGAKNSALVLMVASLLTNETVHISNVPNLTDINVMSKLLSSIGASIKRTESELYISTNSLRSSPKSLSYELVNALRASFVCIGPLLSRFGEVRIPLPGGCRIGSRPIDEHIKGLKALGAKVRFEKEEILAQVTTPQKKLIGSRVNLSCKSVGATETILMAAILAEGETIIENAAQEPEIQDLTNMLVKMGAKIKGAGTSQIKIEGVERLNGCSHKVIPDRIEAGTFLIASAITGCPLTISPVIPEHLGAVISKLRVLTAKDVILATGSDPFVPPGIEIDGRTVFTSDEAISLEWLPRWIAIIGSGYIGLEFADIYTALGCEVTMIEALERVMPTFDPDITKIASRNLISARDIETKSNLLASKVQPGCPVKIELSDAKTRELVEEIEVDAVLVATGRVPRSKDLNLESMNVETNRGFIPIDDSMRVLVKGDPSPHLWAVGDVTGKLMLAHTAAAQGTVAVENILGKQREINYRSIPAATFTHPEISSVGLSEDDARELSAAEGFQLGVVRSYFKANSKALAELESDGLMKLLFRKDTGEILGAHIYGLHAADLIQEVANALSRNQSVVDLAMEIHTHPTLSEVVEVAYKQAVHQMKSS